jgi:hypothetical protein
MEFGKMVNYTQIFSKQSAGGIFDGRILPDAYYIPKVLHTFSHYADSGGSAALLSYV